MLLLSSLLLLWHSPGTSLSLIAYAYRLLLHRFGYMLHTKIKCAWLTLPAFTILLLLVCGEVSFDRERLGLLWCLCLSPNLLLHGFCGWGTLKTVELSTETDRVMSAPLLCVFQAFDGKFVLYVAVIVASVLCTVVGDLSLCCDACLRPSR